MKNLSSFSIGQVVKYTNGNHLFVQSGTIVKITHQLIIINDAAGMVLWNAGYAVGDCISPSQVID